MSMFFFIVTDIPSSLLEQNKETVDAFNKSFQKLMAEVEKNGLGKGGRS